MFQQAERGEYVLYHRLFNEVAEKFRRRRKISGHAIEKATEDLKNPFREFNDNSEFSKINFDEDENCYVYLKRLATCHASLTELAVNEILSGHPGELYTILNSDRLSVVSLGSGPGNDAIGFCGALAGHRLFTSAGRVDVCNVDLWECWSSLHDKIVKVTGKNPEKFFAELTVRFDFLQADLLSDTPRNHVRRIRDADVVLIVKLVSILPERDRDKFLKMVLSNMKAGSVIIYIDTQAHLLKYLAEDRGLEVMVQPNGTRWYPFDCNCEYCIPGSSYDICVLRI